MITAKNLVRKFKSGESSIIALNDVSFDIKEGDFVSITGRSGSGKSTLLYQMSALDEPTSGSVDISGVKLEELSNKERAQFRLNQLGYVFQDYALLPELTAIENVMVPLFMQGLSNTDAYKKALSAMQQVGLSDRLNNLPSQLSGGQQQRVSIARAIAHDPKIIFADEPTANLDTETSGMILKIFLELNRRGQTIIMVTHEQEYAETSNRIIELSDGKIISDKKNIQKSI